MRATSFGGLDALPRIFVIFYLFFVFFKHVCPAERIRTTSFRAKLAQPFKSVKFGLHTGVLKRNARLLVLGARMALAPKARFSMHPAI